MKENDPINIRRVANGFIVEAWVRREIIGELADTMVFNTVDQLRAWLVRHYPEPDPE